MPDEVVGVVGAGTMGAGIAQLALEAGHEVVLHDVDEEAIQQGRARIRAGLGRRAAKLDLDADTIDEWVEGRYVRLRDGHSLDALGAEADVVIEAALEDLALKRTIFRTLDGAASPDAILATNTSALSIASIADATDHPERVVGLHFFNPAPVMKLVEVVSGPATSPPVAARAADLVTSWGCEPVACIDSPGFIVNRVNRPFTIEALRMLEAGEASVETIDAALRGAGYPMGPFELMDLIGVDVNLAVATAIWDGLGRPDRLRPSPIQEQLVADEHLGRKSGIGFYTYEGGSRRTRADRDEPATLSNPEIVARIETGIATEAVLARDERVADEQSIERALRLGAGHPRGPFERLRT